MNKELLFDSFSHLDESLLERSEATKPCIVWRKWAGAAACLALAAVLGLAVVRANPRGSQVRPLRPGETWEDAVQGYNPDVTYATPADAEAAEHEWEAGYMPSQGETENWDTPPVVGSPAIAMLPNNASAEIPVLPWVESYPMDVDACYAAPKNGEVGYSIPLREAMDEYGDDARYRVVVDRFQNEQPMDPVGDGVEAEMDRLAAVGIVSAYERVYDHDALEHAYFTIHASRYELEHFPPSDEYGYMLFLYAERVPDYEPAPEAVYSGSIAIDSAPTDVTVATPPFTGAHLTQEQAYADADYGAYLCQPPAGFDEREFLRVDDVLLASFRRGYDYVDWHVSHAANDAAIAAADLTPELVAERMYRLNDAGDTDGLRIMNFCVDYGGIFVRVTAKGVTAEWLYEQLDALR